VKRCARALDAQALTAQGGELSAASDERHVDTAVREQPAD
jgi:hypothetical protein